MHKITKKVDKAQAQILFLVLIAIAFIGQGIHDFIKKNRAGSRRPATHPAKRHSPQATRYHAQVESANRATTGRPMAESHTDHDISAEIPEPDMPDSADAIKQTKTAGSTVPNSDELRKAVIWSEILKRKF